MAKSLIKNTLFLIILFLFKTSLKAQHYFYADIKFPVYELVLGLANDKKDVNGQRIINPLKETAGFVLDGGFGFKTFGNLYLETGINYLVVATNIEKDKKFGNTLTIKNYILSTQIRPIYRPIISIDKDVFLNVGCGFNYQKINSNANYQNYFIDANNFESSTLSHSKTQSNYFINIQPYLGIDFKKIKKAGFRLGLTYLHQDYNRSEKALKFTNDPKLKIAPHKRGDFFITLGVLI